MSETLLALENIGKTYNTGSFSVEVLKGLTFDIKQGEFIALMGASGSGKSTLMNILGCLDVPTVGTYLLDGKNVSHANDEELADIRNEKIGFIFQTFNLLAKYTALDNVALPLIYAGKDKTERIQRATAVLEKVGLGDRMHHKPNELSGGQRQRVAIARALVNNPAILLADEPTGNLDSTTTLEILDLFDELHQAGNTIIMVTHEEEVGERAEKIIRMKDGKII
ncbi:MAG: ABC transporter ATP-binding protein [Salibacteraceae bacterium]|jgi:putative ABC transport system ATP-binding protein|nr:ABC transporter ATP-binding protein [Salibacteraceae bacterium]MDP4685807.1 ABC transporter ATP-binding protein [Salibacteraceae bacterium]MDP4762360.1 ABC transporter ATP-binding protein [Salibacteraceae bacterium]MDP4842969.1 ABC transporter ATP-binding protein [Salibacteraceae bacterium]MDP4966017.1 ABC transporter ATP-binding protein [Salibacteraceae bacterium]